MVANPTPLNAFLVGVIVFAPGVAFLAALQVIATARAGVGLNALALIIVVVITCCWSGSRSCSTSPCRESPRVFYGWLRAHGKAILTVVLIAAALIMVGNGSTGSPWPGDLRAETAPARLTRSGGFAQASRGDTQ